MDELGFLGRGGVVPARMREIDWAATAAGPVAGWPEVLRTWLASLLTSPQPTALCWGEGLATFVNDAYLPILGERAEGALGRPFAALWPEAWPDLAPLLAAAWAGEGARAEDLPVRLRRDGRESTALWSLSLTPVRDSAGTVRGLWCVTAEAPATGRIAAEARRRQSQKMEAIGQLTGGVAHDFNNLLTPIVGALDVLQRRSLGGAREQRLIDGARASAERARSLVGRLLAFASRQPLEVGPVDLAGLVEGLRHLVVSTVGPQVRVTVHAAQNLPPAVADAGQLEIAILNLAVHARDAMPEGGALALSAAREEVGEGALLPPGSYLRLRVEATGEGAAPDPGSDAPAPGGPDASADAGPDASLAAVEGLAHRLGGAMEIEGAAGRGMRVTLWLPAARRAALLRVAAVEGIGTRAPGARPGTALLVEGEPAPRAAAAAMLAGLGWRVAEAACADEALRLVAEGLAPDLLVTDQGGPGLSGADLALRLRAGRPGLRVLIVDEPAPPEEAGAVPRRAATLGAALRPARRA